MTLSFWRGGTKDDFVEAITLSYFVYGIVHVTYYNNADQTGNSYGIYKNDESSANTYIITQAAQLLEDGWTVA